MATYDADSVEIAIGGRRFDGETIDVTLDPRPVDSEGRARREVSFGVTVEAAIPFYETIEQVTIDFGNSEVADRVAAWMRDNAGPRVPFSEGVVGAVPEWARIAPIVMSPETLARATLAMGVARRDAASPLLGITIDGATEIVTVDGIVEGVIALGNDAARRGVFERSAWRRRILADLADSQRPPVTAAELRARLYTATKRLRRNGRIGEAMEYAPATAPLPLP